MNKDYIISWEAPFYHLSKLKTYFYLIPILIFTVLAIYYIEIAMIFLGIYAIILSIVYFFLTLVNNTTGDDVWQVLFMEKIKAKYSINKDNLLIEGKGYNKTINFKDIAGVDFEYRKFIIVRFSYSSHERPLSNRPEFQHTNLEYKKNIIGYIKYREIYIPRENLDIITKKLKSQIKYQQEKEIIKK